MVFNLDARSTEESVRVLEQEINSFIRENPENFYIVDEYGTIFKPKGKIEIVVFKKE